MHIALAYLVGLFAAVVAGWSVRYSHPFIVVIVADITATVVICIFSRLHNNTSVYDPYWSIVPILIALYLAWAQVSAETGLWSIARMIVVCILVLLWGGRLTYNWVSRWPGMHYEDWRYADLRPKVGRLFWPLSFIGFQFFPTIIVLIACLPLFPAFGGTTPFNILDVLACTVTLGAIGIEAIADKQLSRFIQSKPSAEKILNSGLWRYSRHPNYFGEVSFWWGIYLFGIAATPFYEHVWSIVAPLTITALFVWVSIPLIERHMLVRRAQYAEQIGRVSPLVPWPPRR